MQRPLQRPHRLGSSREQERQARQFSNEAALLEHFHHFVLIVQLGDLHRGLAVRVPGHYRRAVLHQKLAAFLLAVSSGVMERGVFVFVQDVEVRPFLDQGLHDIHLSVPARKMDGRSAFGVLHVLVCTGLQESLHGVEITRAGSADDVVFFFLLFFFFLFALALLCFLVFRPGPTAHRAGHPLEPLGKATAHGFTKLLEHFWIVPVLHHGWHTTFFDFSEDGCDFRIALQHFHLFLHLLFHGVVAHALKEAGHGGILHHFAS
mmetsp:Transcript_6242/g.38786  ORF Transcript_6242/g.38786 Transcript_6242/m.38786 type:complete len:262 (-) Transcript_6242:618-1403(-)